ncbi:hypothetical protein [Halobellus limi]|uniref:TFIIB-type domain-containing protein n=1 Tax=Halobellus limi TaxID=699433 RepID=A0A1H5ZEX0_9EURY|nr:hypothetical protein [Halobellus limi]QCC48125.1 hypothetical protein DV707_10880 [Halobellus limi]SEG34614.1 hypothetical protein SAMN04488133_1961 [Halobellus limi]
MRSDYDYPVSVGRYYLVWDVPDEKRVEKIPVDPSTHELGDGWAEVFDDSLDLLVVLPEFTLQFEATAGLHSKTGCILKRTRFVTKSCPECFDETGTIHKGYVDEVGDDVCPRCGMILTGSRVEATTDDRYFTQTRGSVDDGQKGFPAIDHIPQHSYRPGNAGNGSREDME